MNTLADKSYFDHLHVPKSCFGGDVLLEGRSELAGEGESEGGEEERKGDEGKTPEGGLTSAKGNPGKGRGENDVGGEVGAASGVDSQVVFARVESSPRFSDRGGQRFGGEVREDEEAGRVGMSGHGDAVRARKHVERGVFERMIASCFEDEGQVEDHKNDYKRETRFLRETWFLCLEH